MTFLDHTQRLTRLGGIPLDEWSVCRKDLYLTIHTTLITDIHAPPPSGGIQTHNLNKQEDADLRLRPRPATGTGVRLISNYKIGIPKEFDNFSNDW